MILRRRSLPTALQAEGAGPEGSEQFARVHWQHITAVVATIAACWPMITALFQVVGRKVYVAGDSALIDIAVHDVWSTHPPLVGMYSRAGWYHPGPALFYAASILPLVTGRQTWATLASCTLLEMIAVAWSARLAWRIGRLPLVLAVLSVQVLSLVAIRDFFPFTQPWNPSVALPFLPVLLLMVWQVGRGETRRLPWVLLIGTFIIQTHIGYGLLIVAGLVWCLVALWRQQSYSIRSWTTGGKIACVVAVGLWLPPLVDEVSGSGNATRLVKYFGLHRNFRSVFAVDNLLDTRPLGFATAGRLWSAQFAPVPPWLGGRGDGFHTLATGQIAKEASLWWGLLAVGMVVTAVLLLRIRDQVARYTAAFFALMVAVVYVSIAEARGGAYSFAFFWYYTGAITIMIFAIGAVLTLPRLWSRRWVRGLTMSAMAGTVVVGSILLTIGLVDNVSPGGYGGELVKQLTRTLAEPEHSTRVMLAGDPSTLFGVLDELSRRGLDVKVNPAIADARLNGRYARGPVDEIWFIAIGVDSSLLRVEPGAHVLAEYSSLPILEEAALRRDQVLLAGQLRRLGLATDVFLLNQFNVSVRLRGVRGIDHAAVNRVALLNSDLAKHGGSRIAIVAFAKDEAPADYVQLTVGG